MEMKINSSLIKSLRKQKLWSQDQLASACGLSLRTIQRVEADGKASGDTVQALAAVFEVNHQTLLLATSDIGTYKNIQLGVFIISLCISVCVASALALGDGRLSLSSFVGLNVIISFVCVLFSTLTTTVDADTLEWHFSFGFLRKKLALSDIDHVTQVRNKWWWGLGIRLLPNGWLYNVSGLDAVEIKLSDGRCFRIGSDDAKKFTQVINSALPVVR